MRNASICKNYTAYADDAGYTHSSKLRLALLLVDIEDPICPTRIHLHDDMLHSQTRVANHNMDGCTRGHRLCNECVRFYEFAISLWLHIVSSLQLIKVQLHTNIQTAPVGCGKYSSNQEALALSSYLYLYALSGCWLMQKIMENVSRKFRAGAQSNIHDVDGSRKVTVLLGCSKTWITISWLCLK